MTDCLSCWRRLNQKFSEEWLYIADFFKCVWEIIGLVFGLRPVGLRSVACRRAVDILRPHAVRCGNKVTLETVCRLRQRLARGLFWQALSLSFWCLESFISWVAWSNELEQA